MPDFRTLNRTKLTVSRFAVGVTTGTLYFVTDWQKHTGMVLIGKGVMLGREGHELRITPEEMLPTGTVIEITT